MGFLRQEYWGGLLFPPLGYLPDPGIEPTSPVSPALQMDSLPAETPLHCFPHVHHTLFKNDLDFWRVQACSFVSLSGRFPIVSFGLFLYPSCFLTAESYF